MSAFQLDFFKSSEQCEIDSLRKEVNDIKISLDKQRKKQFSLIGAQNKIIEDLKLRLTAIEQGLCHATNTHTNITDSKANSHTNTI